MVRATYRDIADLLSCKASFKGNSVTAKREIDGYKVYSYSTLIYSVTNTGEIYFNNNYYSVTTSKLQNIICRLLGQKTRRDI
jgi:hypothetical protein